MDNKDLHEKLLTTKKLFDGKVVNLRVDTIELPNGNSATREVVEHPGAVAIVPILPDGRIIMVRQYRHPILRTLLEIPAGKLDKGEKPEDCAYRELEEETGYKADSLIHLTSIFTAPGFSDEIIHIYKTEGMKKSRQNLDDDEFLAVEIWDADDVKNMIINKEINDSKTVIGFCLAGLF